MLNDKTREEEIRKQQEERFAQRLIQKAARPERLLDAARILELANKAYFLYVRQNHTERAKLLKMVLLNCGIDKVSLYPSYREPFDLIFQRVKTQKNGAPGGVRTPDP